MEFAERLQVILRETGAAPTPLNAEAAPVGSIARRRPHWPLYAGVATVAAGVIVTSVILLPNKDSLPPGGADRAGAAAERGQPERTAGQGDRQRDPRQREHTPFHMDIHASAADDMFVWRTNDELRTGTVDVPSVELYAPGALCIGVKVVRADKTNASADEWSPEGCGS